MTTDELRRRLEGGAVPAVLAAVGPESFLREEALRTAALAFLGSAESPDVVVIQPDAGLESVAQTAARFLGEARTASLFGGRKIVALHAADAVVAAARPAFVAWLAAPAPSVLGVLLAEELPADVLAAAQSRGVVVACGGRVGEGAGAREFPEAFARRRAAERGKRLSQADARDLVERVGDEFAALDNAVEIASLHAGDAAAITAVDLAALLPGGGGATVWEFGDRLVEGDVAGALEQAERCFADGVPEDYAGARFTFDERRIAQKLLGSFTSSATRALVLRRQLDAGAPRSSLQFPAPVFRGGLPWKAKERIVRVAARRRADALEAMLLHAEETERATKTGGPDGRLAISRLATAVGTLR